MDEKAEANKEAEERAKEAHSFWLEVGRTMDVWQRCEEQLCEIFVLIVQSTVSDVVRASFYKVISIQTKRAMIDAALSVRLENEEIKQVWKKLSKEVERWSGKRNLLAHGTRWDHAGVSVMAPHFADVLNRDRHMAASDEKLLDAKAIHQLQKDFWQLTGKLKRFHHELGAHLLSFGKPINLPNGRL